MAIKVMVNGVFEGSYVEYNSILDFWDGNNMTSGEVGRHLGITKLKSTGEYVLIFGTQWEGERDSAEVVSDETALMHIVDNGHTDLLDEKKYHRLRDLLKSSMDEACDDIETEEVGV